MKVFRGTLHGCMACVDACPKFSFERLLGLTLSLRVVEKYAGPGTAEESEKIGEAFFSVVKVDLIVMLHVDILQFDCLGGHSFYASVH